MNTKKTQLCSLIIGTSQSSSKRPSMGVDSGAEVTVGSPELFEEVATVESKRITPRSEVLRTRRQKTTPTLHNNGK